MIWSIICFNIFASVCMYVYIERMECSHGRSEKETEQNSQSRMETA